MTRKISSEKKRLISAAIFPIMLFYAVLHVGCFVFEFFQFIVIPPCRSKQKTIYTASRLKRRAANTLAIASGYGTFLGE